MKKIILLLLTLASVTSCLDGVDRHDKRTAYGAAILYEGTGEALSWGDFVLTAVEMDIVARAPIEIRDSLADAFFPYSKFRINGNKYTLSRDNAVHLEITTDNQSITIENARWEITKFSSNDQGQQPLTITCLTPNSWTLETMQSAQSSPFRLEFTSQRNKIDISPRNELCEISLDEVAIIDRYRKVQHSLTTPNPLIIRYYNYGDEYPYQYSYNYNYNYNYSYSYNYSYPRYHIVDGAIEDNFKNPTTQKIERVEARFTPPSASTQISYCGFTDSWAWESIPNYFVRMRFGFH